MKNLKNILAAFAFVFAIGAAFAFTAPKNTLAFDAKTVDSNCTLEVNAPAGCSLSTSGTPCLFGTSQLVGIDETNCSTSLIYRQD